MSPGRLDATVVRRHMAALERALRHLKTRQGKPLGALTGDLSEAWIIERGLQLCIQSALDIATHLAASAGHDAPDYASAIDGLARLGVLPADFATGFRAVAGFRNILVHGYLELDPQRVHAILNERLGDFDDFLRHVEAWLSRAAP